MSDPGYIGNVPPAVPAGTLTNPVAPDAQTPTSTSARMLDTLRETNGAGMMSYNAALMYPVGTVGRAILDAGLGTTPWGNVTGDINNQTDLMAQFAVRDNNLATHEADHANPHVVTKTQVGLSNVDNTADVDKPVSTAQAAAIALKLNTFNSQPTGTFRFPVGSTTVAPALWQAGSLLTVPANHSFEWDGTWLNITNAATVRKRLALLDAGTNVLPLSQGGLAASDVAGALATLQITGQPTFRNLAKNGDIRANILQQAATTIHNSALADMWTMGNTATARLTGQQEATTLFPGYTHCLLVTATTAGAPAAGDYHINSTSFEGIDVASLGWGAAGAASVTITVQVRASVAGTYALSIRNAAANRSYVTPLVVNNANTVETKTFVIPGDTSGTWVTTTAASWSVSVGYAVGSTFQTGSSNTWLAGNFIGLTGQTQLTSTGAATFRLTGFQLEPGLVATPFERIPFDVNLTRVQRYFETTYPYGVAPGTASVAGMFRAPAINTSTIVTLGPLWKVQKMTTPTVQVNDPNNGAANTVRETATGNHIALTGLTGPHQWGIDQLASAAAFTAGGYYEFHALANSRM